MPLPKNLIEKITEKEIEERKNLYYNTVIIINIFNLKIESIEMDDIKGRML